MYMYICILYAYMQFVKPNYAGFNKTRNRLEGCWTPRT
jgi:hypothetical protein